MQNGRTRAQFSRRFDRHDTMTHCRKTGCIASGPGADIQN